MALPEAQSLAHRLSAKADVTDNSQSPIQGYESAPIVDLETAVKSLKDIVPDVGHMVLNVKYNCATKKTYLSVDEHAAISLYTQPWNAEKSFYLFLNRALRDGNRDHLAHFFPYLKLFVTALGKIPIERRHVYRGVRQNIAGEYHRDHAYYWWAFNSCTTSVDVLQEELFLGKDGTRTMFDIECHSGRHITEFSTLQKENEVLLLPGFHFKVKAKLDAGNGLIIIQIEELDAQPPPPGNPPPFNGEHKNEELEQAIAKSNLPKLNLKTLTVKDQDMHIVIRKGLVENNFKVLDLGFNEITHRGVAVLSVALQNNRQLEELNLENNLSSDSGVKILASVLNSTVLKRLDLSENDITGEGVQHLAKALESNKTLVHLSLSHNRITDAAVRPLIDVLTHNNAHLEILNLGANENIGDGSIAPLKDMIKQNSVLKRLDLRCCGFSEQGRSELSAEAKSIRRLRIWT